MCACSVAQSSLTLCDPTGCSLPGSSVHGIIQARKLEWVAMPSSRGSSRSGDQARIHLPVLASRFFTTSATWVEPFKKSHGEGNGNPLQYSCLENPIDRGAWQATVHSVAQSQTRLKRLTIHACTSCLKLMMCKWGLVKRANRATNNPDGTNLHFFL